MSATFVLLAAEGQRWSAPVKPQIDADASSRDTPGLGPLPPLSAVSGAMTPETADKLSGGLPDPAYRKYAFPPRPRCHCPAAAQQVAAIGSLHRAPWPSTIGLARHSLAIEGRIPADAPAFPRICHTNNLSN